MGKFLGYLLDIIVLLVMLRMVYGALRHLFARKPSRWGSSSVRLLHARADTMTYVLVWVVIQSFVFVLAEAVVAGIHVFQARNEFSSAGARILYQQSFFSILIQLLARRWHFAMPIIALITLSLTLGKLLSDAEERRAAMKAGYGPDKSTWWKGS
jgi:hypothetical protein